MPVPARSAGQLVRSRRHRGRHAGRVAREFSSRRLPTAARAPAPPEARAPALPAQSDSGGGSEGAVEAPFDDLALAEAVDDGQAPVAPERARRDLHADRRLTALVLVPVHHRDDPADGLRREAPRNRSEEHTSELQSQSNLVCRLLLEKKK